MAVFRIEKTRDYTVMSNHHLRNQSLSLKVKGLLSMMLSLPEEWNYATRGLASICKEGTDSIGSALKELERTGYIVRNRLRDSKGKILDVEYSEELDYKIVGSTEANSLKGKISNESPVGKALIGHKVGDTVEVETPAGVFSYKILEIQRSNVE